jgi:hypothetical protein
MERREAAPGCDLEVCGHGLLRVSPEVCGRDPGLRLADVEPWLSRVLQVPVVSTRGKAR